MEVAKKKPVVKVREKRLNRAKESSLEIISNIEKWSVDQKINIIDAGVSKTEFEEVKKQTGLDYETLSNILSVTKATLHSKKGNEKFNATVSERILMLAEIYAYGIEIFEDKSRFNQWLLSNLIALGGKRPVDYLHTQYGMEEIKNLIGRIAYGVYS
jgi:putative toxin-antitoxin system antitoxin component (TIGR02293 family)